MNWRGFCDVSVALFDVRVMLSKKTLDVHQISDFMEFADAVPMDLQNVHSGIVHILLDDVRLYLA